eukprot:TRINITY_DN183_c0_g1_i3.p1 TRINITY_DN183_c0_g1~~TRINITY_DN183_c0_g1_i3.p1  ORF type:complete len:268 (+),score=43.69 TRINITY_DN183_c0_g1_i3:1257-2060(+)
MNLKKLQSLAFVPKLLKPSANLLFLQPVGIPLPAALDPASNNNITAAKLHLLGAALVLKLEEVHKQGLLHLDLRPRNLILRALPSEDPSEKFWSDNIIMIDWETALPINTTVTGVLGVQWFQSLAWLEANSKGQSYTVTPFDDLESLAYTIYDCVLIACGDKHSAANNFEEIKVLRSLPDLINDFLNELWRQKNTRKLNYSRLAHSLRESSKQIETADSNASSAETANLGADRKTCGAIIKRNNKFDFCRSHKNACRWHRISNSSSQ